jgi:glycerophosphoryl diester phosphodiesterase
MRRVVPGQGLAASPQGGTEAAHRGVLPTLSGVRSGKLPPWADIAGPPFGALRADPGFVLRAAAHGHPTYCWTIDEPAEVALCAELGVTYLATNCPGAARRQLGGS